MRFHWGWKLAIVYSTFAMATLAFVVFSFSVNTDLVRDDYYEHSLKENQHKAARARANSLQPPPSVRTHKTGIVISMPAGLNVTRGLIGLSRPSDRRKDKTFSINLDADGSMLIPADSIAAGRWDITVEWETNGKGYLINESLMFTK